MKRGFAALFLVFTVVLSCSSAGRSERILRAVERGDVEIVGNRSGLIRTLYCDIYVENLSRDLFDKIREADVFRGSGRGMPLEPCFQLIISNTWNKPFTVEKIVLRYDNADHEPETYDYIKDPEYMSGRFSVNLRAMQRYRRLLSDDELISEIDYDAETVEYRSGFIAPGDKVLFFRYFPVVPQRKGVKMYITIKYFDVKKIIDFDIARFDYTEE